MEHSQAGDATNKISIESRKSNFSFSKSLGRPSWNEVRDPSLDKKASLIYVMSIESERNSDLYEKLLESDKKPINRASHVLNNSLIPFSNEQLPDMNNQRNSDMNERFFSYDIQHECSCGLGCEQTECPCYQAKNQICVRGSCCTNCIILKKALLRDSFISNNGNANGDLQIQIENPFSTEDHQQEMTCNCKNTECLKSYCKCFQNGNYCSKQCGCESCKNKFDSEERNIALQAIKTSGEVVFCTCKKTKCMKKYCSCYAAGIKCGKHCACENCLNCINHDPSMDVEVYEGDEEEDYRNIEMPQKMSFEPVCFE